MELISKPGCNDSEDVIADEGAASVITSRFWSTRPYEEMARFIEPSRWVECGRPFWRRMDLVDGTRSDFESGEVKGYRATYVEEVDLPVVTLNVRLDVTYQTRPGLVRLDYDLAADDPREQVTVDRGFLAATDDTLGESGETTLVEGAKVISFRDPLLNSLPDLACDGGWVYMMINMALAGAGITVPFTPSAGVLGATPADPPAAHQDLGPVVAAIETEIETWTRQATTSLAGHGAATKAAVRRVVAPRHDPRWINDLIGMGRGAVDTAGATFGAWRRILRHLGKLGDR